MHKQPSPLSFHEGICALSRGRRGGLMVATDHPSLLHPVGPDARDPRTVLHGEAKAL